MKRILIAAAAALSLAGPMAGVASAAPNDRGHNERRDNDRSERRDNDRNDNRGGWDQRQNNGYMYRGQWHYGAPTAQVMRDRTYSPGYHNWRRGDRLSAYERAHYRQVDYRRDHLRAPPRGYNYVRSDRGELLLVGVATGVILSVLASH